MPAQPVYTCEVSPSAVVAARFRRAGGRVECESFWERPIPIDAPGGWTFELPRVFASLNEEARIRGPIRIALTGRLVLTRVLGVPLLRGRARERVVRFEAEQMLPYSSQDYVWACGNVDGGSGEALWVAAARRDVVEAVFTAAEAACIEVLSIEPTPLVMAARSARADAGSTGPRALVHADGGGVDIVVVDGTKSVVRSVAIERGVAAAAAATANARGGRVGSIGSSTTWHARVRQEVMRTLAHHRRSGGAPITLMHVVAPRLAEPTLIAALQDDHGAAVVRPLDLRCGSTAGDPGSEEEAAAVLYALASETDKRRSVNLVPRRTLRQARWRRSRPWLQATAALCALAFVMPLLDARERLQVARHELALLERAAAVRREFERRWEDERRAVDEARMRVEQLDRLMDARGAWVRVLSELQAITLPGGGIWIESLTPVETEIVTARARPARGLFDDGAVPSPEPTREHAGNGAAYLLVACLLDPSSAKTADDQVFRRARAWLDKLGHCPQVIAVEHERFEPDASGLLRVKVVVRLELVGGSVTA